MSKEEKLVCSEHFADEKIIKGINEDLKKEDGIESLSKLYKALGDATRLRIVYVLSKSPLCVCDIAILLDMSQSAISHHLRVLRDLNLVKFKKEGKLVIYSLDDSHVLRLFEEGLEHIKHQEWLLINSRGNKYYINSWQIYPLGVSCKYNN